MKHVLHWTSFSIICWVAMPIYEAHGGWAYAGAIAALAVALLLQWIEGRMASENGWSYRFWDGR